MRRREGDALEALDRFTATLQDPNASRADKQLALRFVVHLVGDLHQPLHVGKCCDKGGNDVKVKWFGKPTNLHAVWDSALVDDEQLSFTELAAKLERHISNRGRHRMVGHQPARLDQRERRDPRDALSAAGEAKPQRRRGKKRKAPPLPELSYAYVYKFTPVMERRLSQAGVRLAAYLNAIFAEPQPLPRQMMPQDRRRACGAFRSPPAPHRSRRRAGRDRRPVEVQILAFNDFHGNLEAPDAGRGDRGRRHQAQDRDRRRRQPRWRRSPACAPAIRTR